MSKLFDLLNSIITKVNKAVRYSDAQNLTDEQKAQARTNIGAVSVNEVPEQVQADHSQNDRTQPDFIKNRTHYQDTFVDIGYPVEFMDGTHNVGDIVLLKAVSKNVLKWFYIAGINAPYTTTLALYLKFEVTYSGGTYTIDIECKDTVASNGSPIVEITEFSTGNIKALYYSSQQPYIAWYFISDLTTLPDDAKALFPKTGIYAQVVNDLQSASSIQTGCYIKQYVKLDSKYLNIPTATNNAAGVVKPVSKTDEMTQPVGVDENGELFTEKPGGSGDGDMMKSVYDPNNRAKDMFKYADDAAKLAVTNHELGGDAHSDIRNLITGLTNRLNALADSDDTTLDQLSEIVAHIKSNKSLIDAITTNKVSVTDIVNDLTTNVANKPLSAAQGVALKALIDGITVPDKLPNPNALTFTGAVEATYDGGESVEVVIPQGWSEKWELISDITTEEEVGEVVIENMSLKKVFIQAAVIGTTSNQSAVNGHIKINGFSYFYANTLSFNVDMTRFTCSFVEVLGDSKRHQSASLNNNTYQANAQHTGWFGDGTPINTVVFNAASANGRVFGIGSNFKIWGLK